VKLKTLALVKWEKRGPEEWTGVCDALDGTQYIAKAVCATAINGGWYAYLVANGAIVHQSEHGSRNEAQLEAAKALQRAIDLREG
jgi:hypothetical protein